VGPCKHGTEPLDSMKVGAFINQLSDCKLFELLQHVEMVKHTYILEVLATSLFWVKVMQT
jgi:hypothetical protein